MVDWREKFAEANQAAQKEAHAKKKQEEERDRKRAEFDRAKIEIRSAWPEFMIDLHAQVIAAFQLLEPPFRNVEVEDVSAYNPGYLAAAKIEVSIDGRMMPEILEMKCNGDGRVDCTANSFKGNFAKNFTLPTGDPNTYMGIVGDFLLHITKSK